MPFVQIINLSFWEIDQRLSYICHLMCFENVLIDFMDLIYRSNENR